MRAHRGVVLLAPMASSFKATIKIRGVNPYILVSVSRARRIKPGWQKPIPVVAHINGKPTAGSRTNMMPAGDGSFYLYLNGIMRKASGTTLGDLVRVEISFDGAYRGGLQHPMPRQFKKLLDENPQASKNWNALTPSRKKEVLRYFAQLKSPEARARNFARALTVLSGQTARFMGREWRNGS